MKKGIDLQTYELKENLINLINEAVLPPSLVKYILNDILQQIIIVEQDSIQKQKEEYENSLNQENE